MGKTVMVLVIPEPKVRKETAKPVRKHKDKTEYSRKAKHKTPDWGSFLSEGLKWNPSVSGRCLTVSGVLTDCRIFFATYWVDRHHG